MDKEIYVELKWREGKKEKMPKIKGHRENKPTYKKKSESLRHGAIQYGHTKSGARKFRIWKTKKGWSVGRK